MGRGGRIREQRYAKTSKRVQPKELIPAQRFLRWPLGFLRGPIHQSAWALGKPPVHWPSYYWKEEGRRLRTKGGRPLAALRRRRRPPEGSLEEFDKEIVVWDAVDEHANILRARNEVEARRKGDENI